MKATVTQEIIVTGEDVVAHLRPGAPVDVVSVDGDVAHCREASLGDFDAPVSHLDIREK